MVAAWVAAAALLAGSVVGLVVVGDGDGTTLATKPAAQVLADAAGAAKTAKSLRFTFTLKSSGAGGVSLKMEGIQEEATGRSSLTETLPLPNGLLELHLVGDRDTIYLEVPEARRAAAGGKQWVALDAAQFRSTSVGRASPLSFLDQLATVGNDVQTVGHNTVDGVATTHYKANLDVGKALKDIPALSGMASQLPAPGVVPIDVWVDHDGRARRLRETFSVQSVSIIGEMNVTDYDNAPRIDLPAAADARRAADINEAIGIIGFGR